MSRDVLFAYRRYIPRACIALLIVFLWAAPIPTRQESPPKPSPTVRLDSPQQVQSTDPRVCVHTRLTDEVEEYKIQATLRLVREMGAVSIVEFFPWSYIELEKGHYDWSHADRTLKHAQNQGIQVFARLGLVPEWAQQDGTDNPKNANYLPNEHIADFARFVGAFVERYHEQIKHVIIWNEPNLNFEWGGRAPDPIAYTELLKQAYSAAHAANPEIIVISGALSPTLAIPGGAQGGWDDLDYLRLMYENGASAYFDALGAHNYPFSYPPQMEPAPDLLNFRRIELWRDIMQAYGDGDKPVYITETGWNDHPRFSYAVSPSQRINYTLEMYRYTKDSYSWLKAICLWQFRLPAPTNSYPDYFTLVSPSFQTKPIYQALQRYTQPLANP